MARYLDISFGLLAFSSSLALMYGAFVESKTWISVWTLTSATVLVGCWVRNNCTNFYFIVLSFSNSQRLQVQKITKAIFLSCKTILLFHFKQLLAFDGNWFNGEIIKTYAATRFDSTTFRSNLREINFLYLYLDKLSHSLNTNIRVETLFCFFQFCHL